MTAPGSSLGSCRVWVISSFLGLGFFCADTPGTRTRQQAHANSAHPFMVLLRFRVAVNGAGAWAGIMGLISGRRRSGRCAGARIRIVANEDLTSAVAASPGQGNDGCPHVEEEEEKDAPVSSPQVLVFTAGVGLRGPDWVARHRTAMVARAPLHARRQTDRGLRRQPAEDDAGVPALLRQAAE